MPQVGRGRFQPTTGLVTFPPTPSSGGVQSYTLSTPSQGTDLFENFSNANGNVTLGLRSIHPGPGIAITVNQGVIYLSSDTASPDFTEISGTVDYHQIPPELAKVHVVVSFAGKPVSQPIFIPLSQNLQFPADFAGSISYADNWATGNAIFEIAVVHLGVTHTVGTVIFDDSSGAATFSSDGVIDVETGDIFKITPPGIQDNSLADVALNFMAIRQ